MKIVAVDIGNTSTSFGVFKGEDLVSFFDIKTNTMQTAFELFFTIKAAFQAINIELESIDTFKIASVVPDMEALFCDLFSNIFKAKFIIISNKNIPLKINLHSPSEVGVDRLLNIHSALSLYNIQTEGVLVIDFGTATTLDVGLKSFTYEGGIIFPGINLSLNALKNGTAKLPKINLEKPNSIIGKSTSEAINSGIFYGYSSMINGIVKDMQAIHNLEVIITGGLSSVIKDFFNFKFVFNPTLTLEGIKNIL